MKTKFFLTFLGLITLITAHAQFTWEQQESFSMESLTDVFFIDAKTGWAVGNKGTILKTTDGGNLWGGLNSSTSQNLRTVFFIDENTGWAGGDAESALVPLIMKTTNGGLTWTKQPVTGSNSSFVKDVFFRDENVGWFVTGIGGEIWYTEDGGTTWTREDLSSTISSASINELAVTPNRAFAGIRATTTETRKGRILERLETGMKYSWLPDQSSAVDADDEITSIFFLNDTVGFAGGKNMKLYKLENQENVDWAFNYQALTTGGPIEAISFGGEQTGWFLQNTTGDMGTEGVVFQTNNTGETWSELPRITGRMNKLYALDANNLWVVGDGGLIFKGMDVAAVKTIPTLTQVRIFPNPVESNLTLSLELEEKTHLTMHLYNSIGQQVRALHNGLIPAGQTTLQFGSMDELQSGTYFLRIHSAEGGVKTLSVVRP